MGIPCAQLTISLGGYVRTTVTPLDRLKATREITWGLWSYPNHSLYPLDKHKGTREITWGLARIRTIATPLDRHKRPPGKSLGGYGFEP